MKFRLFLITFFFCAVAFAQKGTIAGVLTDKDANNTTLPFANALIKGTNTGVSTDENGKYSISVAPGDYTIIFSFLGYENAEVPVTVVAGETVTVNKALGSGSYKLEDVVIKTAAAKRSKETALLLDQKNAVEIKQSIGAQELARKGVNDVATAVTKTTGVTKQEGSGTVYVRGLGDRYNGTTMNGLPIPSSDPEKKNINLEIFSTDIVEYISIDKVYSSRLSGDFAGGNVDIVSKDYSGNGFFKIDMGSNANTNAIKADNFRLRKGIKPFGFSNSDIPQDALTKYNYNTLSTEKSTPFAGNLGFSGGDSFHIGGEGKLSLFATANFSNGYFSKGNGSAAGGINSEATGNGNEQGYFGKKFDNYESYAYSTNTTGMANINYKINSSNKISYNSLYVNSSTQSQEYYSGRIVDLANDGNGLIIRSNYLKDQLFINQLLGEHKLGKQINANWGVSRNIVKEDLPDRATNTLNKTDSGYVLNSQSFPNNNRYFQNLKEAETAVKAAVDFSFIKNDEGDFKGKITFGYNGRFKKRDFASTQFNFKSTTNFLNTNVDPLNLDAFYNQSNLANNAFTITTFRGGYQTPETSLKPQTYNGNQKIHAGFADVNYQFTPKFTAVAGIRIEKINQEIVWDTQLDPDEKDGNNFSALNKTAFLPNLILKYELTDKQNLRFGFSKTYTLPQFKERAPFVYEDITEVHTGNPYLYSSDNYNADLKWEMFPKKEELLSVTAFGKIIQNPINEITIASSTNDISYVNSGNQGMVIGGEVEFRKSIFATEEENAQNLSFGLNASYTYTDQDLNSEKVKKETDFEVDFTNTKAQFTGSSPLLANVDLTYSKAFAKKEANISGTVAYSYFSDRIYSLGTTNRGDLVDKAIGTLDLILKSQFNKNLGMGLSFKNLLNPTVNRVQENKGGDVNVLSYTKGLQLGLSLNYQF